MGEALPGPGYELIELRAANPSDFAWIWTIYGVERLLREHVTWVVVHESPDLSYSRLDSSFIAIKDESRREYDRSGDSCTTTQVTCSRKSRSTPYIVHIQAKSEGLAARNSISS